LESVKVMDGPMDIPTSVFAMSIAIRPKSGNKRHAKYEARLKAAAISAYQSQALSGRFFVRVIWFHKVSLLQDDPDTDNISKPIVDALRGVVYADDHMVVKRLAQRVDMTGGLGSITLKDKGAPPGAIDELLRLFGGPEPHVVYVEVGLLGAEDVALGIID
jgi:Holliday junction resolvase RusA-like endonuclease